MTRRLQVVVLTASLVVVALGLLSAYLLRDPSPHFEARRSALAAVTEQQPTEDEGYVRQRIRLTAESGLSLELTVSRAAADSGRRLPLAVVLGGHYTGADAVRLLGPHPGVVVAALSYPFDGDLRPTAFTFLKQVPLIRRAFLDTPPAIMLALDYLSRRPEVDSTRMEAVGVSLGAPFIVIAGALDPRFRRVWAVHGSGGSYAPLEVSMRRSISAAPLRIPAAALASVIIAGPRLDPVHWVPRIRPRPFVMVNARDDERMPRDAVDALYASAREPKEQVWMDGGHVHGDRPTIQRLVQIVLPRVRDGL